MDLKTHPHFAALKNAHDGDAKPSALVVFENRDQGRQYGTNAPTFCRKSLRCCPVKFNILFRIFIIPVQ
jgi:hypothetical protein